jgi:prepilin-type N-terminal cleavage/methylation domain-containing protein
MEEKKSQKHFPSLWSFSNFRNACLPLFRKFNAPNFTSPLGFTLVELLVVIMIIGIFVSITLLILNPTTQIQKGQDATRQHDLKQLQTALDTYYNDNNFYPQSLTTLVDNNDIQAIPNDPNASNGSNYAYLSDGQNNILAGSTPQWNVLFAKLAFPAASQASFYCPLEKLKDSSGDMCVPTNYLSLGYNYCVISGSPNCDQIVGDSITPLPISAPPSADTPTPTPAPFYCYCVNAASYRDLNIADITHQCQIGRGDDSVLDTNRYCDAFCQKPCTP